MRLLNPQSVKGGALVLVVVVILFVLRVAFPDAFLAILSPLWRAGETSTARVGAVESFFVDKQSLAAERDRLLTENTALVVENGLLRAKVEDLTKLVGTRTESEQGIVAGVLARPPISPYDVLIVDRGSMDEVEVGVLAFGNGGTPLGTVAATTKHSSRVLLFSAPGRESAASVGENRIPITLIGQGSGAFTTEVSKDAGIVVGDQVYVAGPGSLPVGTVIAVLTDPSATTARVRIRPIVNPFSSTWVTLSTLLPL